MSIFLVHGFKWDRSNVRVHTVLQEVDDAAPNNLMSGHSECAMRENFEELYPGPMKHLPHLRFIEPLNPNNEKFAYPSEPYVFICDVVVRSEDYIDIAEVTTRGVSPAAWNAMAELRDEIAKEEKIAWYAVHNGDLDLARQEREAKQEDDGDEETDGAADRIEEEQNIEQNYSKGLSMGVARMQINGNIDGKNKALSKGANKPGKFKKLLRGSKQ